jgi:GNAT superfamily N-acetyltransferase
MAEDPSSTPGLQIVPADLADQNQIQAAIELGNAARATLGHLPYAAYFAAAEDGTLVLASLDGTVVGYALYGLTRGRIRLTHLCVDPAARGHGMARQLVNEISRRHPEHFGIRASCRRDYGLAPMWISLGFEQVGERRGRSREGHVLTDWWLDHGFPHLFSVDVDSVLVRAAVDMNILRNWIESGRPGHADSLSLLADHLTDRLALFRTSGLDAEIETLNGPLREQCLSRAGSLSRAPRDHQRHTALIEHLKVEARAVEPLYPRTRQDEFDLQHVAAAIAGNLNVFVTMDSDLKRVLSAAAEKLGLRILHPADVVVRIDELARAEAYRPVDLEDTAYVERLIGSGEDEIVKNLANVPSGERPLDLLRSARQLAIAGGDRLGIYSPSGELVGLFGFQQIGKVISVPMLRISRSSIGETLIRQLLFRLRQLARDRGADVITIDKSLIQQKALVAAVEDGFLEHGDVLYAFVIDHIGLAAAIEHAAVRAARAAGLPPPPSLRSGMTPIAAAALERAWWPAKVLDSELRTYMVPIQQVYSAELLGVPQSLLRRDDNLGLSREHVYYRRPGTQRLAAPSRLLWYMSEGGRAVEKAAVVGCSQLDAVHVAPARDLHSRFQHLGVYELGTVLEAERNGNAQALRFTNTEIFRHRIPRESMRVIAAKVGVTISAPQSPRSIPAASFNALYREGMSQ